MWTGQFAGYNLDYVQLSHLPGGNYGRWSTVTVVALTLFHPSAEHDTEAGVFTAAVCSVQHSGCSHPGDLPLTFNQSSVSIPNYYEGPGSKRTPDYCHQPEPTQGSFGFQ
jgi:hypothetical protein